LTGNVTASLFDAGEELAEKTSPFDNYIQIIDGAADITINNKVHHLALGEGIIISGNASHVFNAKEQFKMLSTVIKSGYEV
jgi:quercetin dioxygenase-like cupin family protein